MSDPGHDPPDPGLADLSWEVPQRFLGVDSDAAAPQGADVVILPVPYEATTSYGGGAGNGPSAIINASRYIETYDQELDSEPFEIGVHTLPPLALTKASPESAMAQLESAYAAVMDAFPDRFVLMLGGEHSISAPAIRAVAATTKERLHVLQFDAHADLRDEYEGTPASHASAMARVLDHADVVGVGIRALSIEEARFADAHEGVELVFADDMWETDAWIERVMARLGDPVYITFDVDYFDPSLMPATGTPEPGGGDWYRTLRLLRRVFHERTVLAADVVELAPIPGLHAPDFLAAKLVHKFVAYRSERVRKD